MALQLSYKNDVWTLEDELGIGVAGDQLAQIVLQTSTPFTIGVTGKWGSGKTSVLRRAFATLGGLPLEQAMPLGESHVEERDIKETWEQLKLFHIEGKEIKPNEARQTALGSLGWQQEDYQRAARSLCIWYSPWQHQNADNPLIPLLLEIRAQFKVQAGLIQKLEQFNQKGGIAGLVFLEQLTQIALNLLSKGKLGTEMMKSMQTVKQAWDGEEGKLTQLSDGQRFHLLFEEAVETLLDVLKVTDASAKDSRLIVFIDDLDRCEDSVVVQLLESIKLYLNSQRCVFVLGIDDSAVFKAVSNQWKHRGDDANWEYLEKLFQATISVPIPDYKKVFKFIDERLEKHDFIEVERTKLARMIQELLEPNPRKIKNFLNSLCATWMLLQGSQQSEIERVNDVPVRFSEVFVLMHYVRLYHRSVWRLLERQPWALQVLTRVLAVSGSGDREVSSSGLKLPKGFDNQQQKMLQELFSRSFLHVLEDVQTAEDLNQYRGVQLDQAVELFNDRIDRKRSDECFIRYYREIVSPAWEALPSALLHIHIDLSKTKK